MHAHDLQPETSRHGLLARYGSARELIEAARRVNAAGYRNFDAYTPYPIEELNEIVADHHHSKVPLVCLVGGILGALGGLALTWWTSAVDYPLNIGGKPYNSWPAFIPVIFECTVLLASFSAGIGMLALNKLPEPYHPVFNVEEFRAHASRDGYFLCIEADDPAFDERSARELLVAAGAREVHDVAA